jgi:hypothetical protein
VRGESFVQTFDRIRVIGDGMLADGMLADRSLLGGLLGRAWSVFVLCVSSRHLVWAIRMAISGGDMVFRFRMGGSLGNRFYL